MAFVRCIFSLCFLLWSGQLLFDTSQLNSSPYLFFIFPFLVCTNCRSSYVFFIILLYIMYFLQSGGYKLPSRLDARQHLESYSSEASCCVSSWVCKRGDKSSYKNYSRLQLRWFPRRPSAVYFRVVSRCTAKRGRGTILVAIESMHHSEMREDAILSVHRCNATRIHHSSAISRFPKSFWKFTCTIQAAAQFGGEHSFSSPESYALSYTTFFWAWLCRAIPQTTSISQF